jgi:hypothetical protein
MVPFIYLFLKLLAYKRKVFVPFSLVFKSWANFIKLFGTQSYYTILRIKLERFDSGKFFHSGKVFLGRVV